jgi:hypothetical protein
MRTLEDALEEITPTPDPDFVADMEWRMRRGFPASRRRSLPRIDLARFRPRTVAAVAASALLALLVAVSLTGGDERGRPTTDPLVAEDTSGGAEDLSGHGSGAAAPESMTTDARSTSLPQPIPPPGGGDFAPGADARRIERSAQLTLASNPDDFDGVADAIFRTADRHDGFVLNSSFTQGEEDFSSGSFELRVPANQLQPVLADLSRLATVRSRSESGTDVTGTFVSVRDRLRTALALRTSLLRRLELATTDTAERALRRRLEIVGNRITGLRAEFRGIRERTEYATVLVALVDKDADAVASETDEAMDDAVGSLEDVLTFLIRAGGVLIPLGVAALLGWLVAAYLRRRARERSLA